MIRLVGTDGHTLQLIFSWFVFNSIGSFVLILITKDWIFPRAEHWVDIVMMIVCASIAHYMMNHAGRFCPAGVGSILRSTDVVWAYLWEITVFKINPNFWAIIGAMLVFFSGAIIGFSKESESSEQKEKGFIELTNKEEEHERKSESPQPMKAKFEPTVFSEPVEVEDITSLKKDQITQDCTDSGNLKNLLLSPDTVE